MSLNSGLSFLVKSSFEWSSSSLSPEPTIVPICNLVASGSVHKSLSHKFLLSLSLSLSLSPSSVLLFLTKQTQHSTVSPACPGEAARRRHPAQPVLCKAPPQVSVAARSADRCLARQAHKLLSTSSWVWFWVNNRGCWNYLTSLCMTLGNIFTWSLWTQKYHVWVGVFPRRGKRVKKKS